MFAALCVLAVAVLAGAGSPAAEAPRPLTPQESDFYASSVAPALTVIKIALPAAPEGWVREGETVIDRAHPGMTGEDIANFHFTYTAAYRRTAGVDEETAKLKAGAAEIAKRHSDAADAQLRELNAKKAETEKAIKKAQQRKEIGRERKLKQQLEEVRQRIAAVSQERDRKILEDTDPLVVRDTLLEVRVTVNESEAEYPDLNSFSRPKAAFALRRDSEREGATGWKPGRTVILYGDWQEVKNNVFRLRKEERQFSARAQSVRITLTGDRSRTEQFLRKTDMRSILDLMK